MTNATIQAAPLVGRLASGAGHWSEVRAQFLAAVALDQRPSVMLRLGDSHYGGGGLRQWLGALAAGTAIMPDAVPPTLVQVYLTDDAAAPLHDCAVCGLAIPVRPDRDFDGAGEPEQVYFPACPGCGGPTGRYARLCRSQRRVQPG